MPKTGNFLKSIFIKGYLQATEWLYGPFAWAYDAAAWLVSFGAWPRWRRAALDYLIPGQILETGFGTGSLLVEMTQRGKQVTGIDPSWRMQGVAGRKLSRQGLYARRVCGAAQALPFPNRTFDNVLSTFPTNYIADPDSLAEIHRILIPAGRWVITGMGLHFKSGFKQFLMGWLLGGFENSWINSFTDQVKQAGFAPKLVQHETEAYVLPILILEVNNEG